MPTYEYKCLKCGHAFDAFQQITAKPLKACPECKGKVKRLISAGSGVIFKGSGFYATDYKKKKSSSENKKCENSASCPKSDSCPGGKNKKS